MSFKYKLGFIGCGNMAKAIINGVVSSNIVEAKSIIASHSNSSRVIDIDNIIVTTDNNEVISSSEILFLAIKPQVFNEIGKDLVSKCKAKYIISMMAGISSKTISNYVTNSAKVIRIMPNTPCKIGKGVIGVERVNIDKPDREYIISLIASMGAVVEVEETDFDAVVAVSGSGPAYAFMFIRALIDGGVAHGLEYETSKNLAINMVIGAAELAKTGDNLSSMIDAVCSKGGTTIQAVDYYRENNLEEIIKTGMDKCYNRSKELSK